MARTTTMLQSNALPKHTRLLNSRKRIYEVAFGNASVCCVEAADVAAAAALFPMAAMKKKRRRPRRRSPGNKQTRYMQAMHRLHTLRGTHIDCTLKDKHTHRLHMSGSDNREAHTQRLHTKTTRSDHREALQRFGLRQANNNDHRTTSNDWERPTICGEPFSDLNPTLQ